MLGGCAIYTQLRTFEHQPRRADPVDQPFRLTGEWAGAE